MKKLLGIAALILMFASSAFAVEGYTTTHSNVPGTNIKKISISWTSAADGTCTINVRAVYGYILNVVTNPDGVSAPTDLYDIVINPASAQTAAGLDIMGGTLADRSTSSTETAVPTVDGTNTVYGPYYVAYPLTIEVSNAGDTKVGVIDIWVADE